MSTRTHAPHDTQYRAPVWATQSQIDRIKATLTDNNLYLGPWDLTWKRLEAHEIDVRTPGDGTRIEVGKASQMIDYLTAHGYLPAWAKPGAQAQTRTPFPKVPAGHYAVTSATGNNDLDFYRVDVPEDGKWAGCSFVKRIIGGHPDTPVRGAEAKAALQRILDEGVDAAGLRYGQEVGRCRKCNRHLTDDESRAAGIGPDCAARAA